MRLCKNFFWLLVSVLIFEACSKKDITPPPTPPSCANNISPQSGATVIAGEHITLKWSSVSGASSYDLYLDTVPVPTQLALSDIPADRFAVHYVSPIAGKTYYWYVVPKNTAGTATGCASSVTSYTSF